jgi:hypothetical protein
MANGSSKTTNGPQPKTEFEIVPVNSGPDWSGRYGRRPNPAFEGERRNGRRRRAVREDGRGSGPAEDPN